MLFEAPAGTLGIFNWVTLDTTTGAASTEWTMPVQYDYTSSVVAVDEQFLYVLAPGAEHQLVGYVVSLSGTGATSSSTLTAIPLPTLVKPPGGAAATADGKYLYVSEDGALEGYSVDPTTGELTPVPGSPYTSGALPAVVIEPSGRFLYAADQNGQGAIWGYAIGTGGALTPVPGSPFAASPLSAPGQPQAISATSTTVYAALFGTGGVGAYTINQSTGALTEIQGSPFAAGSQTDGLALVGKFLYANDFDGNLYGFSTGSSSGALTSLPSANLTNYALTLTPDPNNKFLFVGGYYSAYDYAVDPDTGALTPAGLQIGAEGLPVMAAANIKESN